MFSSFSAAGAKAAFAFGGTGGGWGTDSGVGGATSEHEPVKEADDAINIKVVLLGDPQTGKSTFTMRHMTGEFQNDYNPTLGVEVKRIPFHTTRGKIIFTIWDIGTNLETNPMLNEIKDGYLIQANAALIFFDVTSRPTYQSVPEWFKHFRRVCNDEPVVLLGNKVDLKDRKVTPKDINFHRTVNIQYYDISCRSNYNYEKPFLYIARKHLNDPDIRFVESPPLVIPPQQSAPVAAGKGPKDFSGWDAVATKPSPAAVSKSRPAAAAAQAATESVIDQLARTPSVPVRGMILVQFLYVKLAEAPRVQHERIVDFKQRIKSGHKATLEMLNAIVLAAIATRDEEDLLDSLNHLL